MMAIDAVFDDRIALSLEGMGDNHRRFAFHGRGLLQGLVDSGPVVAVDLEDFPIKRPPFVGQRF